MFVCSKTRREDLVLLLRVSASDKNFRTGLTEVYFMCSAIGRDEQFLSVNLRIIPNLSVQPFVLGALKNRLIKTVLLRPTTYVLVEN